MTCSLVRYLILLSVLHDALCTHTQTYSPNELECNGFCVNFIESLLRLVRWVFARIVALIANERESSFIVKLILFFGVGALVSSSPLVSSSFSLTFRMYFLHLPWQMKPTNQTNFIKKTFHYFLHCWSHAPGNVNAKGSCSWIFICVDARTQPICCSFTQRGLDFICSIDILIQSQILMNLFRMYGKFCACNNFGCVVNEISCRVHMHYTRRILHIKSQAYTEIKPKNCDHN